MKKILLHLLLTIPLLYSCQDKYNSLPYNETEKKLRMLPDETNRVVIYKDWQKMDSLSYLRLKNIQSIVIDTDVDSIPTWIVRFKKLSTIWSFSNRLRYIPENIGENSSVKHLVLDNSKIQKIPSSICQLENLESLSIMNNQISELPDCFSNLKKIKEINLYNNQINDIPESIYHLSNLNEIILKKNPLKKPEKIKRRFTEKGIKVILE